MRITDDRLDELVEDFTAGYAGPVDYAAVTLALAELQDRRDDQYEDAESNYETAREYRNPPYPDTDWETEYDIDEDEYVRSGGTILGDPNLAGPYVPPWDRTGSDADDDYDDVPF